MPNTQFELDKDNVAQYVLDKTNIFNKTDPIEVSEVSNENDNSEADGYINFVFRLSQNGKSYILKQARPYTRVRILDALPLPVERNFLEYVSFVLRDGLAKGAAPKVFFADAQNGVFIMEDLTAKNLRVMRFQLNEGREFPGFARKFATFLARSHFYTSELFLDKDVFRALQKDFFNVPMRNIMEDVVLRRFVKEDDDSALGVIGGLVWNSPRLRLETLKARDVLIKKTECLVHGDLHTSNIFISEEEMSVIDMEYSFVGPYSYDLGYFLANFISQYAAFSFNSGFSKEKRERFREYLLNSIAEILENYFDLFRENFNKDAKPIYKNAPGYLDYLFQDILKETMGFMAAANLFRLINLAEFPDFDSIKNPAEKLMAQTLSIAIDKYLFLNRENIKSPRELIENVKNICL
jgi:5-methylthioribose kinase